MFAEEKPALQPLPVEPFRYYQYGKRTVNLDGCVEVEPVTMAHRRAGSAGAFRCNGIPPSPFDEPADRTTPARTPAPGARTPSRQIEDRPKPTPLTTLQLLSRAAHKARRADRGALPRHASERPARPHYAALWAYCRWSRSMAALRSRTLAPPPWKSASAPITTLSRRYLERHPQLSLSLRQVDPLDPPAHVVPRFHRRQNQGEQRMNLIELQRITTTPARRYSRGAGNQTAPGAGRSHGADRSDLLSGERRAYSPQRETLGSAAQTGSIPDPHRTLE